MWALVLLSLSLAVAQWPSCVIPLCQNVYSGDCTGSECCNAQSQLCERQATFCPDIVSYACTIPGGTDQPNTNTLQPFYSDEIFAACGRFIQLNEDPSDAFVTSPTYEDNIFVGCNEVEPLASTCVFPF